MSESRTPGPWFCKQSQSYDIRQKEDCLVYVKDKDNNPLHIAETFQYQNDDNHKENGTSIANAEFIVKACNSHDALVAENERLKTELKNEATLSETRHKLLLGADKKIRKDKPIKDALVRALKWASAVVLDGYEPPVDEEPYQEYLKGLKQFKSALTQAGEEV